MHTAEESSGIEEIICGNNFEYILEESSNFVNTDYKVLQSQTNGIFIPCMKMSRNGKIDLYYITEEYTPFDKMFDQITTEMLITIVVNLFANVIEVRNNGFLACQCIDLSWNKIFVEQNTFKVKLVYLPLAMKSVDSYTVFESELRSSVIQLIDKVIEHRTEKLDQFISDLSNGLLSLEDVYNRTKNVGMPSASFEGAKMESSGSIGNEMSIKLIAMNDPNHFELVIDKENVLIGKKQELVDKVIPFNQMISRKHCRILHTNGTYYIRDEGSANGTYVNQQRVEQGQQCQLKKGDIVRLANSDFQIV